jgi:hypothetical protein
MQQMEIQAQQVQPPLLVQGLWQQVVPAVRGERKELLRLEAVLVDLLQVHRLTEVEFLDFKVQAEEVQAAEVMVEAEVTV